MSRFIFEFHEAGVSETLEEMEFPDTQVAYEEAVRTARELIAEGAHLGLDRKDWICLIRSGGGDVMAEFRFGDVLVKGKPLE